MKKTRTFSTAISAALLIFGATAWAVQGAPADDLQGGPPPGIEKKDQHMQDVLKKLNLTEDQKKRLEAHRQSKKDAMRGNFEAMKAQRTALREELEKPDVDEAKVRSLHEDMKALHNKMADDRLNGILEVRKILTAEQFKKFTELTHGKDGSFGKDGPKKRGRRPEGKGPGDGHSGDWDGRP